MEEQKTTSLKTLRCAHTVVHARVGADGWKVLAELATRKGVSHTQALRDLLEDARERMAEEAFGPRLESLARTLLGVVESSPRAAEIAASAQTKMRALRGES